MSDEEWWEDGPIFSTRDRGGKITALAPGQRVRAFSPGLLALMALSSAVWCAVFVLWLPRGPLQNDHPAAMVDAALSWTGTALLVCAVLAMLVGTYATYAVAHRLFRQIDLAWISSALSAAAGILAGCYIDSIRMGAAVGEAASPDGTVPLILMLSAAAALVAMLVWMPFAIARARRRSRFITSLRQHGERHEGELISIGRADGTTLGLNQFRQGEVVFAGGTRRVGVAMSTSSSRVPLPPFPVLVFTGESGAVHVDPDPAHPWPFDPDTAKYSSSADGGGG